MGNYCLQEENSKQKKNIIKPPPKLKNILQNILSINRKFIDDCNDPYFKNFHKEIVEKDIQELGKFMSIRKIEFSLKSNYPSEDESQQIYKEIVKDIKQNENNVYNQLIFHYSQFLNELFDLGSQITQLQITSYNLGNVKINTQIAKNNLLKRSFSLNVRPIPTLYPDTLQISQFQNQNIARHFYENKKLAYTFLDQIDCIYRILQLIIEFMYGSFIVSLYKSDIESYSDRLLLIYKIYQKDIYKYNPYISIMIQNALYVYYENKSALIKSEFASPQKLNPSLLPEFTDSIKCETSFDLLDSCEKIIYHKPKSDEYYQSLNLPYQQTFSTIENIVNCKMPWLKFKLIGKLDRQIVEIFLCQRSQSQIAHFMDVIKPEDAKIEVLEFILQKYMLTSKNLNLQHCYHELRWMQESDAIVHLKLKSITCPYFSRFISIFEIAYNHYQKKQASQLQLNA